MDVMELIKAMQTSNKRAIAIILTEIEAEFRYMQSIQTQAARLLERVETGDQINVDSLTLVLTRTAQQTPTYEMVRKIVLDTLNDLYRQNLQNIVGDVEGLDARYQRARSYQGS